MHKYTNLHNPKMYIAKVYIDQNIFKNKHTKLTPCILI